MLRHSSVTILLATSVTFFTACGGSSKSKSTDMQTTPVAAAPSDQQPAGTATPTPEETGTPEMDRQNVSGAAETGVTPAGTPPATPSTGTETPAATTDQDKDKSKEMAATEKPLTEANIFAVLSAANEHEIAVAKLAQKGSKNKDVKKFAALMVTEHGKMLANGKKLAKKLNITPEPNDQVETLKSESASVQDRLSGLKGAELDRAFAEQMVQDHEKVLSLIDEKIKPAATSNADLTAALEKDRPMVEHHLDMAKKLQEKLNK